MSSKRVIYVGKSKGETRTYVAETGDLVRKFFAKYGIKEDVVVLSDNGNAFSKLNKALSSPLASNSTSAIPLQYISGFPQTIIGFMALQKLGGDHQLLVSISVMISTLV